MLPETGQGAGGFSSRPTSPLMAPPTTTTLAGRDGVVAVLNTSLAANIIRTVIITTVVIQLHNASGAGMQSRILVIQHCTTPELCSIKKKLYVPSASKNILYVHHLALDTNAFIVFHPFFFLI